MRRLPLESKHNTSIGLAKTTGLTELLGFFLLTLATSMARADDWPQWLGPQRDGVWREAGILDKFPKEGPKIRWRTPIQGGYAGPAVAGGKVYVTDRVLAPGAKDPAGGMGKPRVAGKERVLCLDEATGAILWTHEYDCAYQISYPAGPRATPVVDGANVYTQGAMGDLFCFDTATGKVKWSKNFPKDYGARAPMWGFSANPLLDGDNLICMVGGEGSVAVAFDKSTGKEKWKALSAGEPGYCPPMIYEAAGKRQLIIWHPEAVNSLDPETGKVYWSQPFRVDAGLTIPTPRREGDFLFFSSFYSGSLMLKLAQDKPAASVVWKSKAPGRGTEVPEKSTDLRSIMCTPFLKDGYIYGICSYGELRCLKADTGERVWESLQVTGSAKKQADRWNNAFIIAQGDRFFLFTEKGDLLIAHLSPKGYEELGRAHILDPTNTMAVTRKVLWSHPAFANRSMYARNDKEIVCVDLARGQ